MPTAAPATLATKGDAATAAWKQASHRRRELILSISLIAKARLSDDAISQCCWINQAAARQIDNTGGDDLATLLVACVNLQTMQASSKALDMA